jgi:hypothetical protein
MASDIPVPLESYGMADSPGVVQSVGVMGLTAGTDLSHQAETDAGLSFLLPQRYQLDLTTELDNLRYKLQILRKFASDNCK